jgi:hypothetical protein
MIYFLHFGDIYSDGENVHSFVAKLERSIHARLVCPSGELLATQFAEHVRIRKGHEQLSVPCDDNLKRGQKLPTITNRTKVPLSVLNAMQTILLKSVCMFAFCITTCLGPHETRSLAGQLQIICSCTCSNADCHTQRPVQHCNW